MTKRAEDTFAPELLDRPWPERVEHFKKHILNHVLLRDAYEQLRSVINFPTPGTIVLLYGPSGVGKTTLREGLQRIILAEMRAELEKDPGRIPIVGVKVEAPDDGNFDWKKFYKSLLKALDDVLIDQKTSYHLPGVRRDEAGRLVFDHKATKPDLSEAVISAVEHRRPIAIIADEAQDLGIVASGKKLIDQMNRIKHLADNFKIPFVLAGTYDLLKFRLLNGQLSRRCVEIHLRRYRADVEADVEDFKDVLNSFQKNMPLLEEPDLVGRWDYFYERTLGCVGILKDWLTRALYTSLEQGKQTLQDEYLDAFALPLASCQTMLDDILESETEITKADDQENLDSYRMRLRLVAPAGAPSAKSAANHQPSLLEIAPPAAAKRKANPFQRKAKRDPVGEQELAS